MPDMLKISMSKAIWAVTIKSLQFVNGTMNAFPFFQAPESIHPLKTFRSSDQINWNDLGYGVDSGFCNIKQSVIFLKNRYNSCGGLVIL